jgi:hypothetical protein
MTSVCPIPQHSEFQVDPPSPNGIPPLFMLSEKYKDTAPQNGAVRTSKETALKKLTHPAM